MGPSHFGGGWSFCGRGGIHLLWSRAVRPALELPAAEEVAMKVLRRRVRAVCRSTVARTVETLERRTMLSFFGFDAASYAVGAGPTSAAVADVNGDQKPDILVANHDGKSISLLRGNGDGTFQPAVAIDLQGHAPDSIVAADLTGDGEPDLAVSLPDNNAVAVLQNLADGTFAAPVLYAVGAAPRGMAVADLNGDGKQDLIVADSGSNQLSVLSGTGGGGFAPAASVTTAAPTSYVTAADIDGDGKVDLAVPGPDINLFWGKGDGTFESPTLFNIGGAVTAPIRVIHARFDTKSTLVAATSTGTLVSMENTFARIFGEADPVELPAPATALATGQFDNFHPDDVAALLPANPSGEIAVATGNSGAVQGATPASPQGAPGRALAAGDLNGDGLTDLVEVTDDGAAEVLLDQPLSGPGRNYNSFHLDGPVATFNDELLPFDPQRLSTFTATIDWGDGTSGPGNILLGEANSDTFLVLGSHEYHRDGVYTISTTITDMNGNHGKMTGQDVVTDAPPPPSLDEFPTGGTNQPDFIVPGPAGAMWFGDESAGPANSSAVDLVKPDGSIMSVPLPDAAPGERPLASDAAGNAWTLLVGGKIARVDAMGKVAEFPVPAGTTALARGPGGVIWFLAGGAATDKLGSIAADGTVTTVPLSRPLVTARRMTLGADGNLWATETARSLVARITPQGDVTDFTLPAASGPQDVTAITLGPDGNVWFTEPLSRIVGKITPAGVASISVSSGNPFGIAGGADGGVWVAEPNVDRIERFAADGTVESIALPTGGAMPRDIAAGAGTDPTIWFTEQGARRVVRIDLNTALVISPSHLNLTPGVPFTATLGTFKRGLIPHPNDSADNYNADISWGDGNVSFGTITARPDGGFSVSGQHTYNSDGFRAILLIVTPKFDLPVGVGIPALVDYPLSAGPAAPLHGLRGQDLADATVATFTDTDPQSDPRQFSATIDWGDGTRTTGNVIPITPIGTFKVVGTHAYAAAGTFPLSVHVSDAGGSTIDLPGSATILRPVELFGRAQYADLSFLVQSADFNGDGILDLISVGLGTFNVRLGVGDGTFAPPRVTTLAPGDSAGSLLISDFNGDGKPDLMYEIISSVGGAVPPPTTGVLLGNGDGTFRTAPELAIPFNVIAPADFNGDGRPDVVGGTSGSPTVLLSNGDGTFRVGIPSDRSDRFIEGVVTGDFNGDGKQDFAYAQSVTVPGNTVTSSLNVLFGDGRGGFRPPVNYPVTVSTMGASEFDLLTADFNGDGKPDLAVADSLFNKLDMFLNNGDGTFHGTTSTLQVPFTSGTYAGAPTVADVNDDGRPDLVIPNVGDSAFHIRLGNGDGTFEPDFLLFVPAPGRAAAGDFNRDGLTDLAVTSLTPNTLRVFLGSHISGSPIPPAASEGAPLRDAVLATFSSELGPIDPAGLTASVDWGDGVTTAGAIDAGPNGTVAVSGDHTYGEEGPRVANVTIRDARGPISAADLIIQVADARVTAGGFTVTASPGVPLTAVLADFTDADPAGTLSDYSAQIAWGDRNTSKGVIEPDGHGGFKILGTNTYAAAGSFSAQVTILDSGGATAGAVTFVTVRPDQHGGGTVSGYVFDDLNLDGVRERGEAPLPGVMVYLDQNGNNLPDPSEQAALTAADGSYWLPDVPTGAGTVRVVPPAGTHFTASGGSRDVSIRTGQILNGVDFGIAPLPPTITGASFGFDDAPATLTFVFTEDPASPLTAGSLRVVDRRTGGAVVTPAAVTYDSATHTAVFTLPSALADGDYEATLPSASFVDAYRQPLDGKADGTAADYHFDFFVLAGDINRDRRVGFDDLLALAQHYGSAGTFADGDLTGDGKVAFDDLLVVAQNYGQSLPPLTDSANRKRRRSDSRPTAP